MLSRDLLDHGKGVEATRISNERNVVAHHLDEELARIAALHVGGSVATQLRLAAALGHATCDCNANASRPHEGDDALLPRLCHVFSPHTTCLLSWHHHMSGVSYIQFYYLITLITCSYSMLGIGPNMPQARRSSSCGGPVPVSSFQKAYDLPTMPAA